MKKLVVFLFCLFWASVVHSQSWKSDADSLIVNQLFSNVVDHVDIYAFPELLTLNDTIQLTDGAIIQIPYPNCYGYFIDLVPTANWAHSCKYCFINANLDQTIITANMPPVDEDLICLSIYERSRPNPIPVASDTTIVRNCQTLDSGHKWAVLICSNSSEHRFWFDLSSVYTVLTNVYGFQEAECTEETTPRHIIVTAPKSISQLFNYGLQNLGCGDLNGNDSYIGDFFDYQDESITLYNKENIENIFRCFAGDSYCIDQYSNYELRELQEEDQLFIYITGHGEKDNFGTYFSVPNQFGVITKIYDFELVNWLHGINCSQITLVMQNCYSGGFVEMFLDDIYESGCLCKNRIGQSAASADGVSRKEIYGVYKWSRDYGNNSLANDFTYYWTAAALGYYPYYKTNGILTVEKGPWDANPRIVGSGNMNWSDYFLDYESVLPHRDYDVNPDTDDDGVLSFNELFEFANNLDTWSRQGYYYPNYNDTSDFVFDPQYEPVFPQQYYESTFTKEAATLIGYEGQIDGIVNSGIAGQPYRLCGDLWVSPNSELTMWDVVQSPEDVRIYIKPSGKLLLDGGALSNLPEINSAMWKGVQVWGNSSKHQIIENGRFWQGVLEMRNGASIRNAVTGIDVWDPENEKSTGGIVKVMDSYFINNTTAVFFHPYENQFENNHAPGTMVVKDNVSYFKNCVFSIDEGYFGPDDFEMHVNLFRVRGVKFYGCHFDFVTNNHSSLWPMGIHAWDAGFNLEGICTSGHNGLPCQEFDNSTFNGFYKAVVSVNDGSVGIRAVTVKNTNFDNNSFGVYAVRSGIPLILNSSFSIGRDSIQCAAGIFAEYTPIFTIELDTFYTASHHPYENYGIIIKDSRAQNVIYKNFFDGLYCANLSIGRNNTWITPRNSSDARADILGLEYHCNENVDNWCDFYVHGSDNYSKVGIQNNQGAIYAPANNTFSQNSRFQFMNHGNYNINYYFNIDQLYGEPNYSSNSTCGVILIPTKDTIGCPLHYPSVEIGYNDTLTPVLPEAQRLERETDYYEAYSAYNSIKSVYDNMINGGDTEGEISDIRSAMPSDMWALRAQLLGHSPYLTHEVLVNVIDRDDIFPQSVLFEILSSNPDELKSDTLFNYLHNMNNPLPDYMIALLRLMAGGVTARTAMESLLAFYSQEYRKAAGDIIRNILCDTVIDKTALVGWLGNMNDLESDREIVSIYLEDGNWSDALALASILPSLYGLEGNELVENNDYIDLLNLYHNLYSDGRTTMQLDSTERVIVEHIADYGFGTSQAMAKVIMMEAYGYTNDDCPGGLSLDIPTRGVDYTGYSCTNEDLNRTMGVSVKVSPNPASTWIAVDYSLPIGATEAKFRVFNTLGVNVGTYSLQGEVSQKMIDLRDMPSGVYTYSVQCGQYQRTGKIIIVK